MINFKGVINIKDYGYYNTQNISNWHTGGYSRNNEYLVCQLNNGKNIDLRGVGEEQFTNAFQEAEETGFSVIA